jgi:hypothetical protein
MYRVAADQDTDARWLVIDALARGFDLSRDWLVEGRGKGFEGRDALGRPAVAGVPRWRRAVRALELDPALESEVMELPYGVWRASQTLDPETEGHVPNWVRDALEESLEAWATLFEGVPRPARRTLVDRLRTERGLLLFAFAATPAVVRAEPRGRARVDAAVKALSE